MKMLAAIRRWWKHRTSPTRPGQSARRIISHDPDRDTAFDELQFVERAIPDGGWFKLTIDHALLLGEFDVDGGSVLQFTGDIEFTAGYADGVECTRCTAAFGLPCNYLWRGLILPLREAIDHGGDLTITVRGTTKPGTLVVEKVDLDIDGVRQWRAQLAQRPA